MLLHTAEYPIPIFMLLFGSDLVCIDHWDIKIWSLKIYWSAAPRSPFTPGECLMTHKCSFRETSPLTGSRFFKRLSVDTFFKLITRFVIELNVSLFRCGPTKPLYTMFYSFISFLVFCSVPFRSCHFIWNCLPRDSPTLCTFQVYY